jgi:predicted Zn finger-like uncharacterized protein
LQTMQIRCERCQAEYELNEGEVRVDSTDVQCRVCGHFLAVAQPGLHQTADGASAGRAEPVDDDWHLRTADGRVHRLHGLTSLQGRIIERSVTRMDRVSPDGQAWQYAGEIVELTPFFDVVDEADHDRSEASAAQNQAMQVEPARHMPTSPTQRRSSPPAMAISVPDDDVRASGPSFPAVGGEAAGGGSHEHTHGGLKIFVGLIVAAGVAFAGIKWQRDRFKGTTIATKASGVVSTWTVSRRPVASPPAAQPDLGTASPAAQVPGETATPSPSAQGPVVEALPSAPPGETEKPSDKTGPTSPAAATPESYEKLVADGDRALENGANSKAKDLYQRALRLRPAGTKALSGLGFVALDRGQIPVAYELFKRALAGKPPSGSALFGMAEIHRARGEKALALRSYQRYLQLWPNGSEAAAARRQVSALQPGE